MKRLIYSLVMLLMTLCASAQTDVTNYITNPDFEAERHASGWMREGSFGPQGNDAFPLKHGTTYMERWNGGNTPIGSGNRVYQTIDRLPIGVYTVKAIAQNIRQDNESAKQTDAFLFANDKTTEIGLPAEYSVTTVVADGKLTLGVYLENCTGNYVCVDNFRLYYSEDADMLRPYCQIYIDEANSILTSGSSPERDELVAAIALMERYNSGELSEGIGDAFQRLIDAIDAYKYSKASDSNPYDMTSKIINPSFESGVTGWTSDMVPQSNDGMGSYRDGALYLEKWEGGSGISAYATNIVNTVPSGHYTLKVAAHNILQSNEYATQSGAYIYGETERVAVNRLGEYTVKFTAVGGAEIGFIAENATGNWVAIDNFRLYYRGKASLSELKSILQKQMQTAQSLVSQQMNASLKQDLQNAISMAQSANTEEDVNAAAAALKPAIAAAKPSIAAYSALLKVINETQTAASQVSGSEGSAEMQEALGNAMAVYNNGSATQAQMDEVAAELPNALFKYRVRNGSGTPPTVQTHPVIINGSKIAVGRLTASGSDILECGFCWSENPDPTVFDNHCSDYDEFNGRVYLMPNLKPSTQYYMRAYALNKTYGVGYGDVVRIITGYESAIYWNCESDYNWGDTSDEGNEQVIAAMETALGYLREWTSIRGFHPHLSYGVGYWGAQCSYGGWIDAGESYARNPGVLMHEMGHGIGVGQHWRYTSWDSPLHPTYLWTGERANRVFAFFENQPDQPRNPDGSFPPGGNHTIADGDRVHVCYGLSGVTSRIDLLRQAAFYQGMYEDGLPATSDGACPFYSLESADTLKYYITNEANGLMTKYLMSGNRDKLSYRPATMEEVMADDSYAWNVHYNPYTGFYQLRNVATGRYLSYGSAFVLKDVETPTSAEDIHLMPCRYTTGIKIGTQEVEIKPYWMARGNHAETPEVMALSSSTSNSLAAPSLDFYDTSTIQHWAILSSEQLLNIGQVENEFNADRLRQLVAGSKELVATDHTENDTSVDADFQVKIAEAEALCETIDNATDYVAAVRDFTTAITTFLSKVEPIDVAHPLNITFLLDDPDLENGSSWAGDLDLSRSSTQYTAKNFSFTQTTPTLPKGVYRLRAHGFQRPGVLRTSFNEYNNGTNNVTATYTVTATYKGTNQNMKLCHIAEGAVEEKFNEGGTEARVSSFYMPSNVLSAHVYMQHGLYHNDIVYGITSSSAFTITVSDAETKESYWTVVDGFTIDFYGTKIARNDVTGVPDVDAEGDLTGEVEGYYTLSGMKVGQPVENGITIVKYTDGHTAKIYK